MKTLKTTTVHEIKVISNNDNTFTLITNLGTFRTFKMEKYDYDTCLSFTGKQWRNYLNKSTGYYLVK